LGKNGHIQIGKCDFGINSTGYDALIINSGHASKPIASYNKITPSLDLPYENYRLEMKGRKIFNYVMQEVPQSISKTLKLNKLKIEDIDYFALHQGSEYMLNNLIKYLQIDNNKVLKNLQNVGNTVSSSIPILLSDLLKKNNQFEGFILISGFGVGFSWGSSILKFTKIK